MGSENIMSWPKVPAMVATTWLLLKERVFCRKLAHIVAQNQGNGIIGLINDTINVSALKLWYYISTYTEIFEQTDCIQSRLFSCENEVF